MERFSLMFAVAGVLILAAMTAVADASTKTIFTTTTIDDDTNPISKQMEGYCGQQMVDQQMLSHCSMYLMPFKGRTSGPRAIGNPTEEHLQFCCMQLGNMDKECMCEGIKMMMYNLSPYIQQEMGQMMTMAQNLPKMCKLTDKPCQMKAVWF